MPDLLIRSDSIGAVPFTARGVRISIAAPMARYSLRTRQAQTLETALKVKLPKKIGATEGGIACLGPDEWLMRAPVGTVLPVAEGLPIAVIDVSERAVCLVVEGARSAEVLMSGCPLDLDQFPIGKATRTIYETVEIILIRDGNDRFHVEVWRSFASWLWIALTTAASH